jgi:transcriptional regulator
MYNRPHFKAHSKEELISFLAAHPFVTLCGVDAIGHPVATQVPVLLDHSGDQVFLRGHLMRKQSHTLAFEANPKVLALFQGAHAFVSARHNDDPAAGGTWNYATVQAHCTVEWLDPAGVHQILKDLTDQYEGQLDSPSRFEKISADYMAANLPAIVGFRLRVEKMEEVFKWSQNKSETTRSRILDHLSQGSPAEKALYQDMSRHYALNEQP